MIFTNSKNNNMVDKHNMSSKHHSPIIVKSDTLAECVHALLRMHVGRGKKYSTEMVADLLEIDKRTVASHLGEQGPNAAHLLRYMSFFGPDFVAGILNLIGYYGARSDDHCDSTPLTAMKEMAEGLAALANGMADGRISHDEAPEIIRELEEAGRHAFSLAAQLRVKNGI